MKAWVGLTAIVVTLGCTTQPHAPAAAPTGSISKQFLAALVLRLTERGVLSLDGQVTRYLPEFTRLPPGILVRHLLNHTSGIREPFMLPE